MISGDYNGDGKDDIAAFYDNGNTNTDLHVWLSEGNKFKYQWSSGWWQITIGGYNVNDITGRVVSGDYNGDNKDDIVAFYNYDNNHSVRTNVWHSTGNDFDYVNNSLGYPWKISEAVISKNSSYFRTKTPEKEVIRKGANRFFKVFPNPISDGEYLSIKPKRKLNKPIKITIFDIQGRKINDQRNDVEKNIIGEIFIGRLVKGVYFVNLRSGNIDEIIRVVKN